MSSHVSELTRRRAGDRPERVERFCRAAVEELERVGHDRLTIRAVAARAGVSPASAYTWFASKDHLFAHLFHKLLAEAPTILLTGTTARTRLSETIHQLSGLIAGAPAVSAAATQSLLGADPEVARLRPQIGAVFLGRFAAALGEGGDPRVLDAVAFAFFGALLQAGMGELEYAGIGPRLDGVLAVLLDGDA
ncbi:TetR/AcrR family transcriptional regulator [Spongisporangium articulatum]|uniref:TetR/AcrR family transcriptional regulator n=1 Tax=Spongisporangium articulatum TaxID=3362603 RepID=A0ABW8AV35_9ACTN